MASNNTIVKLARGGCIVKTSAGNMQFGVPPETIKDTIPTEDGVPNIFVLPTELFHWRKGINVADMEFPIYFNFFLCKKKVIIFCTREQAQRLIVAMREAVFGPKKLDLQQDVYPTAGESVYVPDITGELSYFRGKLNLNDLFNIKLFENGNLIYQDVRIHIGADGYFQVFDNDIEIARIPGTVDYSDRSVIGERLPEPFIPPRFAVTCLGPSHGFDPKDNTSGFIVWLNGNGIMIDPPVNSTEWLVRSNVNPKFIDSIILTHCHADHDAGTFQKILEEVRVTIYTTRTIMDSFLRKYAAFSGESISFLRKLFTFRPVYMGYPFYLHGGEFNIFYSVHSIPTMGFRLVFQNRNFVYSSDHQGDPEVQKTMLEQGFITQERYDQLRNFPWNSDVIYHEAGIAPLHTPVGYLNSLSEEIQKKTVVYHIARKDFPAPSETRLTHATFGIENTLYFDTIRAGYEETYRVIDVLKHLDFFSLLAPSKVQEFICIVQKKKFKRGDKIIEEGTVGNEFFIIHSGSVRIDAKYLVRSKYMGSYEYFGEVALLTGAKRTANIFAETDATIYTITRSQFLNFISGTEFERLLHRLIQNRNQRVWNILAGSPFFSVLTDYQRMWLESVLLIEKYSGDGDLLLEGDTLPGIYILLEGEVTCSKDGKDYFRLERGEVMGRFYQYQQNAVSQYSYKHHGDVEMLFISRQDATTFVKNNPGVSMRLDKTIETLYRNRIRLINTLGQSLKVAL